MLHVDAITLKNYRCFPDSSPARIALGQEFTALIGTNNSGKSSILRFFHEYRGLFQTLAGPGNFAEALMGRAQAFTVDVKYDQIEPFCNLNERGIDIELNLSSDEGSIGPNALPLATKVIIEIPRGSNTCVVFIDIQGNERLGGDRIRSVQDMKVTIDRTHVAELTGVSEALGELASTLYIGPFRNIINIGSSDPYFDIRTGQAFVEKWRSLKTGNVKQENEAVDRLTEDIRRIFALDRLQIDSSEDGQTLHLMVDRRSYKLPEVGSGLAQFIIVLASAALADPAYILIDEPELSLHPSLQLDFLTTLATYARIGVLFSTHSIGLARYADRIYSVRETADGGSAVTEYERTPNLSEFLGELSYSGYHALGSPKILLVEGRTDVKTLHQFLRRYRADLQIAVLPLGGADMITGKAEAELNEIKRMSDNVYALIDSEKSAEGDELEPSRAAFAEICKKLGIGCHILERRATENYFSDRAVKKAFTDGHLALQPYQKLSEISPSWPKNKNWRIALEMTKAEIDSTDLGEFLSQL